MRVTVNDVLSAVLLVAAIAACGTAVWALIWVGKASSSLKRLAEDVDASLLPLVQKADITVDALNAELLRVDMIVTRVEQVTERVSSTSHAVQDIVNAPVEMVTDVAGRVRRAWKSRRSGPGVGDAYDEASSDGTVATESLSDEPDDRTI